MALIDWTKDLSVNVAEIDAQHRKLISMLNELNDAMKQGKGKDILGRIINDLYAYAGSHFQTEEKYFDQYKYPETPSHKVKHAEFVKKIADFKNDYESGKVAMTVDLMNFLKDWLKNHIQGTDKKYSTFFNEKGLK
jgi:hemerythrin